MLGCARRPRLPGRLFSTNQWTVRGRRYQAEMAMDQPTMKMWMASCVAANLRLKGRLGRRESGSTTKFITRKTTMP